MLCPEDGHKEFDDLTCRDCKWFYQCFDIWQNQQNFSEGLGDHNAHDEPMGDNFPIEQMKFFNAEITEIAMIRKENRPKITYNDVEDLRIDLETISIKELFKRIENGL